MQPNGVEGSIPKFSPESTVTEANSGQQEGLPGPFLRATRLQESVAEANRQIVGFDHVTTSMLP